MLALSGEGAATTPAAVALYPAREVISAGGELLMHSQRVDATPASTGGRDRQQFGRTESTRDPDPKMFLGLARASGKNLERLEALRLLAYGWDGDNAPPPNGLALENSQRIVELLESRIRTSDVLSISPDVDGGIVVTIPHRSIHRRYAAFSCNNEGETHLILEAPPGVPVVRSTPDDWLDATEDAVEFIAT